jgi:hypothetical protein
MWRDAWKLEYLITRQRLGKHIPAEAKAGNIRGAVFSVVLFALVANFSAEWIKTQQ